MVRTPESRRETITRMAEHPRFESLAKAVRAGCQLIPDPAPPGRYFGVSSSTGRLGCDALAAAWFAEFYDGVRPDDEFASLRRFLSEDLAEAYPVLGKDLGPGCPSGSESTCPHRSEGRTLEQKVVHLQDRHGFTRDQVAAWLQTHSF